MKHEKDGIYVFEKQDPTLSDGVVNNWADIKTHWLSNRFGLQRQC